MSENKKFTRKKRSPFGLVDDVLGDVQKKQTSVSKAFPKNESVGNPENIVKEHTVKIEKHPTIDKTNEIENRTINLDLATEKAESKVPSFSHLDSKLDLYEKFKSLEFGFSKFSNKLIMDILKSNLNATDFKVLIAIIRMTVGWGRQETKLSTGVISDLTGIGTRSRVSNSIKSLKAKGFIYKKSGGFETANVIGLTDLYFNFKKQDETKDKKQIENSPDKYFKSDESVKLTNYLNGIRAKGKKSKEEKALKDLKIIYSINDIENSLDNVLKYGSLKGEKVSLPFTYLNSAIDDILLRVKEKEIRTMDSHKKQLEIDKYKKALEQNKQKEILEKRKRDEVISKIEFELNNRYKNDDLKNKINSYKKELFSEIPFYKSVPRTVTEKKIKLEIARDEKIITQSEFELFGF